ncbi:MAG: hypothetical protein AAF800_07540 [Planctomycetota bacterium]
MTYPSSLFVLLLAFLVTPAAKVEAEAVTFQDTLGKHGVPQSNYQVVITSENDMLQYRIRGEGPTDPQIEPGTGWFVAVVDADTYWVHLGEGRLFRHHWSAPDRSRVDEWTYPRLGEIPLPEAVEDRLKKELDKD